MDEGDIELIVVHKNEIMLDLYPSGPSIGLRVGGPLCRRILTPYTHTETLWGTHFCDDPCSHWTFSLCDHPSGSRIKLDVHHRKIVLVFKYIGARLFKRHPVASSYAITTLVETHQQDCAKPHLGNCFIDILNRYCRFYYVVHEYNGHDFGGLWDIDFPEVNLLSPFLMAMDDPPVNLLEYVSCLVEFVRTEEDWEKKLKLEMDDVKQFEVTWDQMVEQYQEETRRKK
ncbi:unnamed protein product [Owenia fusiformis]|uniref:Uncharacterized protein n=1 Tax=Owenia fusiformis TaxID=6347 RepID=A0A8S4QE19_OWEFU|nr:unnamed protein product [Owenia fusiformis]